MFHYGKSYGRTADECMQEFTDKLIREQNELFKYEAYMAAHPVIMSTIRSRDEVNKALDHFFEKNKYKGNTNL